MKRLTSLLIVILVAMTSCNSAGDGTKYTIDGAVKGGSGTIYLERLNLSQITVIDSAKIAAGGDFHMSSTAEKGFYRLRIDNQHAWLMLLENKPYKVELDYNTPGTGAKYTKGTESNTEFQEAIRAISEQQQKLQVMNQQFQLAQNGGASMDSLQRMATAIQAAGMQLENTMKQKAGATKDVLVALYYTSFLRMDRYPAENKAIVERLNKELPNSSYAKEMAAQVANMEAQIKQQQMAEQSQAQTAIGAQAPELAFKDPSGKEVKLSSLRGKVVLLDFWASWCGPCRRENPNVVAAYNKFKDKGFTIYSVSLDQDGEKWKGAIAQDGLVWPYHVSDLAGWQSAAARTYGVNSIPAQFLLDKEGKIIAKNLRGDQLEEKLREVLQ